MESNEKNLSCQSYHPRCLSFEYVRDLWWSSLFLRQLHVFHLYLHNTTLLFLLKSNIAISFVNIIQTDISNFFFQSAPKKILLPTLTQETSWEIKQILPFPSVCFAKVSKSATLTGRNDKSTIVSFDSQRTVWEDSQFNPGYD